MPSDTSWTMKTEKRFEDAFTQPCEALDLISRTAKKNKQKDTSYMWEAEAGWSL